MGDTSNSISPETLISLLGTREAPLLFDVRRAEVYADAPDAIPSAVWRDHQASALWGRDLPKDREIVVYCVHGHEVSQGAAGGRVTPKPKPGAD